MEFEVIWSDFAESQLDEIFEYYKKKAGERVSIKLIRGIIKGTKNRI